MKYLGCHVGLKAPKFFLGSIEDALSYQADACMIYTGAPQNSKRRPIEDLKIDEGRALAQKAGWSMRQVVVHAPYIINLANSLKPETAQFGREFLAQELKRTAAIGAEYLVLHPGAHLKAGEETGIEWIVQGLDEVLGDDSSNVMICLEGMAGKGSEIGKTFEELHEIIEKSAFSERIGVCLDTCHLNDAGYSIEHFDELLREFDEVIGLEKLKVFHINDSKNLKGARKDRHENIGNGTIGFEALYNVVHHPALAEVIKILETPYIDDKPPYKEEIAALRENRLPDFSKIE